MQSIFLVNKHKPRVSVLPSHCNQKDSLDLRNIQITVHIKDRIVCSLKILSIN